VLLNYCGLACHFTKNSNINKLMNIIKYFLLYNFVMLKTRQITVSESIESELEKIPKWKVLMFLQKNGETSVYSLSKELAWSPSKTHAVINQLEKSKAIKSKTTIINGRAVKLVSLL
jgi:DNA-binding MarR family transcriptional regulator